VDIERFGDVLGRGDPLLAPVLTGERSARRSITDQKIEHVRELLAAYGNALRLLRVEPPA